MKKKLFTMIFAISLCNISFAYSPFTPAEHLQIDRQLNQPLTQSERKEKSDFFSRLSQKSLAIRKAFSPISTKIIGAPLTKKDQQFITERIAFLKRLPDSKRALALKEILKTQQLAEELARSLSIANSPGFEGYAKTVLPTPLFWLPVDDVDLNFVLGGKGTTGLKTDENGLIRDLAVVLPPETALTLMRKISTGDFTYYQVRNREFDIGRGAKFGYFIDARFIQKENEKTEERKQTLPNFETIKENLLASSGLVYVWGGSWSKGIPEIEKFFPSEVPLSKLERKRKLLKGLDCSGLLYQATNGYTPRNTRQLLKFGNEVEIEGLKIDQIISRLKPLDLIVWDGHVVIVLDKKTSIESRGRGKSAGGIEIVSLKKRLEEIVKYRKPVNNYETSPLKKDKKFVIRRRF